MNRCYLVDDGGRREENKMLEAYRAWDGGGCNDCDTVLLKSLFV